MRGESRPSSLCQLLAFFALFAVPAAKDAAAVASAVATADAAAAASCQGSERLALAATGRCTVLCRERAVIGACGIGGPKRQCERVALSVDLDCSRGRLDSNETLALSADPAFARFLASVRSLDLARTHLPTVTGGHLAGLSGLESLTLRDAGIDGLASDALAGPGARLRLLDLTFNRLGRLPADLFAASVGLEVLDLSDNSAAVVLDNPNLLLPLAACLRTLRISGLGLTELPAPFLRHLRGLDSLHLARNRIKELDVYSFVDLSFAIGDVRQGRLTLDFAENQIERVGDFTFSRLRLPMTLSLTGNRIREATFLTHPTVESSDACRWESSSVDLFGNPLLCPCRLYNFTRVKVPGAAITGVCSGPDGLERHLLHGWQFGHSHRARFFEMAALRLCRDEWQADLSRDAGAVAPSGVGNESSATSWRHFGAQYSCRCGRWFDPAAEFLREENCASVLRAAVHAHDDHAEGEHEHPAGAEDRGPGHPGSPASSFADSIRDRGGCYRLEAAASPLLLAFLLQASVLLRPSAL